MGSGLRSSKPSMKPCRRRLRVVLIHAADEDHHLAAVGHRFAKRLAAHQAGVVVVHADVDEPIRFRRVGIVRDEIGLGGGLVENLDLVCGSIGLIAMPSVPRVSRSSILRVWSVIELGVMTSTFTPKSLPALLAPARACSQKSATPLVMNA